MAENVKPSHDRAHFEQSYVTTPPWDISRPQPRFLKLAQEGAFRGRVLDVGCGTGEHAFMTAALGLDTTGIDFSPSAIGQAEAKAKARGIHPRFLVGDALQLEKLGEQFDTVIDSGVFHVFNDPDRVRYVKSLAAATRIGGEYFMACFSDRQPGDWGPRRVTQDEIRASFVEGWQVASIEDAKFDVNMDPPFVYAWLARIRRV